MTDIVSSIAEALYSVHNSQLRAQAEEYLHIYMSDQYDDETRTLAAIYFKNGIEKYWRKTAKNAIPDEQKSSIRDLLFRGSENVPNSVARQNSIAISRIARGDFPSDWPNLFTDLLQTMSTIQDNEKLLIRHLQSLHHTVKALCSLRLSRSRLNFQNVAPDIFNFVGAVYGAYSSRWITSTPDSSGTNDMTISDLVLKIARRLICHGFDTPYREPLCRSFFTLLSSHLVPMWDLFTSCVVDSQEAAIRQGLIAKNLLHAGKLFLDLSSSSMQSYALDYNYVLMPGSMALVKTYWNIVTHTIQTDSEDIKKVKIQGLILLKQCNKLLGTPEVHLGLMKEEDRNVIAESLKLLRNELFAPDSVVRILENLIVLFFVLDQEDIESWNSSPEEWMISQEDEHWQFELRPCAEKVFLELFAQFKPILTEPLLRVLEETSTAQSERSMLMKEAMYNALGLAAAHLFDDFNFDEFLSRLETEIQDPSTPAIFKRRILVLISQWVPVKCSESARSVVYKIVGIHLQAQDPGLCLSAAFAVQRILDDWDWNFDTFGPYSTHYLRCLVNCLAVAESMDAKMRILSTLGMICERMGQQIGPELNSLLDRIPVEWQNSGDQHMIKVALLGLLNRVVLGLKERSSVCYPLAIPLIQYSTDPTNSEHVYLCQDALELWHAILQNTVQPNDHLLHLFPILLRKELLCNATESLGKILYIIESSLLLFGQQLRLDGLDQQLVGDMIIMMPDLDSAALSQFARVLSFAGQIWGPRNFTSGNIIRLTELLLKPNENPVVDVCNLTLLNSLIIVDASYILGIWMAYHEGDLTRPVLEKMATRFDNIGHAKHRKQCAMALTELLSIGHPLFKNEEMQAWVGSIWSDVLAEVQSTGDDLVYWVEDSSLLEDLEVDTVESGRRKDLSERDLVCSTHLKAYIRAHTRLVDSKLLGSDLEGLLQ